MNLRKLADSFLDRAIYWDDYQYATSCPRRVELAQRTRERYYRAYLHLVDRIETADTENAAWRSGYRTS